MDDATPIGEFDEAPVGAPDATPEPIDASVVPLPPANSAYAGDVESSPNPVTVIPSANEKGRLLLQGGCMTLALAFVVAAFAGAFAGLAGARMALSGLTGSPQEIRVTGGTTDEPVAAAASAALPTVVNIDVSGTASRTVQTDTLPKGHPDVPFAGQGSGVAYKSAPGGGTYIITNDHVVDNATEIVVTAVDGPRVSATLVGRDPETDIAVVKVSVALPLIVRADSTKLAVGQMAVAIGSPYGLQHSVSAGVVSGLHRSLPDDYSSNNSGVYPLVDVIQTDAAINPGNSGGALVDRTGRLIGINSAIYSDTGANAGIGFAIPTKTAVRVADELIAGGKAKHPFLGILGQTVDATLAKEKKLPVEEGALVVEVTKGTGAEKAGLKAGDVIVALDGAAIRSMDDLILAVRQKDVDQSVQLTLWRGGGKIEVPMTVGDKPATK
ncbi:MAG TPA: trypsin-like peptidase domain-containing protein [Coriobacteriia bacterium]